MIPENGIKWIYFSSRSGCMPWISFQFTEKALILKMHNNPMKVCEP